MTDDIKQTLELKVSTLNKLYKKHFIEKDEYTSYMIQLMGLKEE